MNRAKFWQKVNSVKWLSLAVLALSSLVFFELWISYTAAAESLSPLLMPPILSESQHPQVGSGRADRLRPTWTLNWTDEHRRLSVVILTPISNSESDLRYFFELVNNLSYPHERLSLVLGEDSSSDESYSLAVQLAAEYNGSFHEVGVVKLSGRIKKEHSWHWKHDYENQLKRRSHLARARNQLLWAALRQEHDVVVWMDSDVRSVPADLVQVLIASEKDIVVPSCYFADEMGIERVYDLNTWKETAQSMEYQKSLPADQLVLEGYQHDSLRLLPQDLLKSGLDFVEVDGVGGCVLLVKAQLHRNGLIFPPFVFDHHIETEGLAKMARRMGYRPFLLPKLRVFHR